MIDMPHTQSFVPEIPDPSAGCKICELIRTAALFQRAFFRKLTCYFQITVFISPNYLLVFSTKRFTYSNKAALDVERIRHQPVSVEILDKIYFCLECKNVFLFRTDVGDHQEMYGHEMVREVPFG